MTAKPQKTLTALKLVPLVLILLSGCGTVNNDAICRELVGDIDAHTSALITDGGPLSQSTGVQLIAGLDGACGF